MATKRVFIRYNAHVENMMKAAERVAKAKLSGKPIDKGMDVISDEGLRGLRLINVGGVCTWVMKTEKHTKTLGYVYPKHDRPLTAPEEARELGGRVKAMLKTDPEKVDEYLSHRHAGKDHEAALAAIAEKPNTWTLRQCFEQTIAGKTDPDSREKIGGGQEKDLRVTMKRPCFQAVLDKPAALVTAEDIEEVRDQIVEDARAVGQKGVRPSNKFVTHVSSVLSYCASHHKKAGLRPDRPWWTFVKPLFEDPVRERTPTIEEVVKTLLIAEEYLTKPLPGRAIQKEGVRSGTLAGLWWIMLTAQRANAGLSLRAHDVVEDQERPGAGWLLAAWDKDVMKAGQSFVLPIPERAWKHVDRFREKNSRKSDDWAFPSESKEDIHATSSGVYRIVYRLAGRDDPVQKPKEDKPPRLKKDGTPWKRPVRTERRNLLEEADIGWWSLHDARRTLTAFMKVQKIPGGASAILAHEVDDDEGLKASATERQRKDFLRQRTAKITRMAYGNEAQFIDLKSEAMTLWTNAVLDEYEKQKADLQLSEIGDAA